MKRVKRNFSIAVPDTNLTMTEWFLKHKVSHKVQSLDFAIVRALDSQVEI